MVGDCDQPRGPERGTSRPGRRERRTGGPGRAGRPAEQAVRSRLRRGGRRHAGRGGSRARRDARDRDRPGLWLGSPASTQTASKWSVRSPRGIRRRCGRAWCAGASSTSPSRSSPRLPPASSTPGCSGHSRPPTRSSIWASPSCWTNGRAASAVDFEAVQLIGERWSARSTELRDIFVRNHVPTGFYDAASPRGQELLAALGLRIRSCRWWCCASGPPSRC